MNVPLLDLKAQFAPMKNEIMEKVTAIFDSQYFILGPHVEKLEKENASLRASLPDDRMIGTGNAMNAIRERIRQAAASDAKVFIHGDNGTGKELIARDIHRQSSRSDKDQIVRKMRLVCAFDDPRIDGSSAGDVLIAHFAQQSIKLLSLDRVVGSRAYGNRILTANRLVRNEHFPIQQRRMFRRGGVLGLCRRGGTESEKNRQTQEQTKWAQHRGRARKPCSLGSLPQGDHALASPTGSSTESDAVVGGVWAACWSSGIEAALTVLESGLEKVVRVIPRLAWCQSTIHFSANAMKTNAKPSSDA